MLTKTLSIFFIFGNVAIFCRRIERNEYMTSYQDDNTPVTPKKCVKDMTEAIEELGNANVQEEPVPDQVKEDDEYFDPETKGIPQDASLIKFLFYSNSVPDTGIEIKFDNKPLFIKNIRYKSNAPWKVLAHGLSQKGATDSFPTGTKNSYVKTKADVNVLVVDWGDLAGAGTLLAPLFYGTAVKNVVTTGRHLSNFLIALKNAGAIKSFADVHIVGFSLGAHVSGVAGQDIFMKTKQKVGRITGLDPAGPEFGPSKDKYEKLDKGDATFVDVIHTCAGRLGNEEALGHVDFYPDGGKVQKACGNMLSDLPGICSHTQATVLFPKTIINPRSLMACKCEPWSYSKSESCTITCKDGIPMGESCPLSATGSYYLKP